MLSRLDFYEISEDLNEENMGIDFLEINLKVDYFITYNTSALNSNDTIFRIQQIRKAEEKAKELLQIIISKVNPDLNKIIEFDSKENDSHKALIYCISMIQNEIERQRTDIMNKISNMDKIDSNKITNNTSISFFASYLNQIVNDLIYIPLRESSIKFLMIKDPAVQDEKVFGSSDVGKLPRDKNLFWYFVFSYLFRSSQVLGFLKSSDAYKNMIPKPLNINDVKKLVKIVQSQMQPPQEHNEGGSKEEEPKANSPQENKSQEEQKIPNEFPEINGAVHQENNFGEGEEEYFNDEEDDDEDEDEYKGDDY